MLSNSTKLHRILLAYCSQQIRKVAVWCATTPPHVLIQVSWNQMVQRSPPLSKPLLAGIPSGFYVVRVESGVRVNVVLAVVDGVVAVTVAL